MSVTKIIEKLQKANEEAKYGTLIEEHKARVEKERLEGPAQNKRKVQIEKRIFLELEKLCPNDVEWRDASFFENPIECQTDYRGKPTVYGSYGWRAAQIVCKKYSISFRIVEERKSSSSWSSSPNGKIRIYTGGYGQKNIYRETKDGTHRYADIARDLYNQIQQQKAIYKAQALKESNKTAVEQVLEGTNFEQYNGVIVSANASKLKPVSVNINVTQTLTAEEAIELLNALKKFNIG